MKTAITIIGVVLVSASLASAVDLKTYKDKYEQSLEEIILAHGMKMSDLGQQYTKSLDVLLTRVKRKGDLNKVTAVMDEIQRFRKENAMPDAPPALLDIKNLQVSYTKQASALEGHNAKRVVTLAAQYDEALKRHQKSLVSSDRLDEARTVQDERTRIQSSQIVTSAKRTISDCAKRPARTGAPQEGPKRLSSHVEWRDLTKTRYKSATGGKWFKEAIKKDDPQQLGDKIYKASEFIMAHALGQIEYEFRRPITEFRATIAVVGQGEIGNVIFKVQTEEETVYTSNPITPKKQEDVHLQFKPTKKLVLITDPNGSDQRDHSLWLHPEVR